MTHPIPPQLRGAGARLGEESGFALIAALAALLITAVLTSAAVAVALQGNGFSRRDVRQKNALEAAEAGLQMALYRLNMLQPSSTNCVGDAVSAPGSNGWCGSSTTSLGNGSSYTFYTTAQLAAGGSCVGATVSDALGITNRCITAVGSAKGVSARAQIRAAAFAARPAFPINGITGVGGINDGPNAAINGSEASDGSIVAQNNAIINGEIELGPTGSYSAGSGASNPAEVRLSSPFVLDPLNPGTSATSNSDGRITNGLARPPVSPFDQASGSISWNPATRSLALGNNASLTLGGSLYNFCSLSAANNATISLAPGVSTEIIIDSPADQGSGCPAGSGTLNVANNWNKLVQSPSALQIYVYGNPSTPGQNTVTLSNNGAFAGTLYAPNSTINLTNNTTFDGAISGYQVNLSNNFQFTWDGSAANIQLTPEGLYFRTAWAQCTANWSSSTPGAGCG